MTPREFLKNLFHIAVAAADPALVVPSNLPDRPPGRTLVIAAVLAPASRKTSATVLASSRNVAKDPRRPPAPCCIGSCDVKIDATDGRVHGA